MGDRSYWNVKKMKSFEDTFAEVTGKKPYPFQVALAEMTECINRAINAPTGSGKTEAVILAWLWNRVILKNPGWPRRLIYCLPMRTLVDQTKVRAENIIKKSGLDVEVHVLMGGELDNEWVRHPDKDMILIGTQDMLLSQAMNRGYTLTHKRWPLHFGLLNNDCLWVADEVQLMDGAISTTIQLQAFREFFGTYRPCHTWWMSATLCPNWLRTVDFPSTLPVLNLSSDDMAVPQLSDIVNANKTIHQGKDVVSDVVSWHNSHPDLKTIVMVNTVQRARDAYESLKKLLPRANIMLIHSRFRLTEREGWLTRIEKADIVVSTQVIEAGVDISCRAMFTEICAWTSFVQRLGRCNRRGGPTAKGDVFWYDVEDTFPYSDIEVAGTKRILATLMNGSSYNLDNYKNDPVFEKVHKWVIRRHDLVELFSTDTDLSSGYLDVTDFVRAHENSFDVYVFWRDFKDPNAMERKFSLCDEICPIRIDQFKDELKEFTKGSYIYNNETERWESLDLEMVRPGLTVLRHLSTGGYNDELGWTGDKNDKPTLYDFKDRPFGRPKYFSEWGTLEQHTDAVTRSMERLLKSLGISDIPQKSMLLAARWHDIGKAHPLWQDRLKGIVPSEGVWAKMNVGYLRPSPVRHEAASAFVAWSLWRRNVPDWTALAVFLVGGHHGWLRSVMRRRPKDIAGSVFGVRNGDVIPVVPGWLDEPFVIDTSSATMGCTGKVEADKFTIMEPSWTDVMAELLGRYNGKPWNSGSIGDDEPRNLGPFRLAFLEALMRVADWTSNDTGGDEK